MPGPVRHALTALFLPALLFTSQASMAELPTMTDAAFAECKAGLQDKAVQAGVSADTVSRVMADVSYLERVIELDRRQPEFTTTFADYLNRRVNESRISKGREMLAEHKDLLARVTRETGVPAPYLVAFWGLETNYGSYFGKMQVPSALTTLACDPRRTDRKSTRLNSSHVRISYAVF